MKLKLDENLGDRGAERLRAAGHDVVTVPDQSMCAFPDDRLIKACREEGRCLVSLDLGFANPLVFRPSEHAGIAVLRPPANPKLEDLHELIDTLIDGLKQGRIAGNLWIIERRRIRQFQED